MALIRPRVLLETDGAPLVLAIVTHFCKLRALRPWPWSLYQFCWKLTVSQLFRDSYTFLQTSSPTAVAPIPPPVLLETDGVRFFWRQLYIFADFEPCASGPSTGSAGNWRCPIYFGVSYRLLQTLSLALMALIPSYVLLEIDGVPFIWATNYPSDNFVWMGRVPTWKCHKMESGCLHRLIFRQENLERPS